LQANLLVGVAVVEEVKMQGVAGWSERELARVRGRLVEFASEMFAALRRKDQRRWGEVYVRGLMLDGKRKSIEPMVARLPDGMSSACSSSSISRRGIRWRSAGRWRCE
jgi:SRSO17 transposase